MSVLGDRIQQMRLKREISQDSMAEKLGITRGGYSSYETGKNVPPADKLSKIADMLKVSADYLLGRSDDPYLPMDEDENKLLKDFMVKTETMLRETGEIQEDKLFSVMKFMEFVFKNDLDESKQKNE